MSIPFVHVQARGSYRELGRAIGEAARRQVHDSVAFFMEDFLAMTAGRLTFAAAEREAAAYLVHARRWLPSCVEELEGMAEGAAVPFTRLLVLNCAEEFTASEPAVGEAPASPAAEQAPASPAAEQAPASPAAEQAPASVAAEQAPARSPAELATEAPSSPSHVTSRAGTAASGDHCTAVAVAAAGRHVLGHNMDWYVIDAVNNVFFDLTTTGGTRMMGIAGAPYLLMLGMNSHGIGNVSNSVHSTDNRVGVPNALVRRWALEAPTLEEARARGLLAARARGTNHVLADTTGRLWDIETSATASAFMESTDAGFMAHTNHYAAPAMAPYEGSDHEESRLRLDAAEHALADGIASGTDPVDLVASVLRWHGPSEEAAMCGHADDSLASADQGMTVSSMICDLDERRVYVCAGPPCENPYQVFSL